MSNMANGMNKYHLFIAVLLLGFMAQIAGAEEKARKSDISAPEQLLDIAKLYLKAASSGDYAPMKQFAEPSLKRMTTGRGGLFYDSNGKEITAYWFISIIAKRPSNNIYDIVLECYATTDDGSAQSTSVHAVAEWRKDHYVLTEW